MNFLLNLNCLWQSDWNGYEVGFDNANVVGLYQLKMNPDIHFYINMETLEVLDVWYVCQDCDCSF